MKKLIFSTAAVILAIAIFCFVLTPLVDEDNISYHEGECVSYREERGFSHSGPSGSRILIILMSNGEEYRLNDRKECYDAVPDLVGCKVKVGATDKYSIYGARRTAYLSLNGQVIYDVEEINGGRIEGYIAISCIGIFVILLINIDLIIDSIYNMSEKKDKKKKKKKRQLMKERRKLGWDHENKDN